MLPILSFALNLLFYFYYFFFFIIHFCILFYYYNFFHPRLFQVRTCVLVATPLVFNLSTLHFKIKFPNRILIRKCNSNPHSNPNLKIQL